MAPFRLALQLRWLRLRWDYPYRWAHKPRCERFRGDVFRIGHLHLCRSCTCVYLAMAIMTGLAIVFYARITPWIVPELSTAAGGTLLLSVPLWYKRLPRWLRDLARAGLGVTLVLDVLCVVGGHAAIGLLGAGVLFAFWRIYFHLRRRRKAAACDGCPHLAANTVCPGFTYQALRVRRYEEAATALLLADGYQPITRKEP